MVIRVNKNYLENDDEGHLYGMHLQYSDLLQQGYYTIQDLLSAWLPSSEDGGYLKFIKEYGLDKIISCEQLELLFTDRNTRMGKHMAGIFSVLVPPQYCSWLQVKNIYERAAVNQGMKEIEISQETADYYMEQLSNTEGLEFRHILCLCRRLRLKSRAELITVLDLYSTAFSKYEYTKLLPDFIVVHSICDALNVNSNMRMLMLDAAGNSALAKLEDPVHFREGLKSIIGGGSLFGAVLNHLLEKAEMNQRKLSEMTGINESAISNYINGNAYPSVSIVHRLADALEANNNARLFMLNTAGGTALAKLDDTRHWREGLRSIIGGGSICGAILYHSRTEKGLRQTELSKMSGIAQTVIARYENGKSYPRDNNTHRLADALETSDSRRKLLLEAANHHENKER